MKNNIFIIFASILFPVIQIFAQPFQFIKNESALLMPKGDKEIKLDGIYETGQIPSEVANLQFRYGLFKRFEVSASGIFARFNEKSQNRFASFNVNTKARLKSLDFNGFIVVNYIKVRITLGKRYTETYTGNYDQILSVVSPYADEGKDLTVGLIARKPVSKYYQFSLGIEYMRAEGRDYFNFEKNQKNVVSALFIPQIHVLKSKMLLMLESKLTYWINRGTIFEAFPEIRWEIIPRFVIEAGTNVPLYGGKNNQFTLGFTRQF
jgi:hypothetical protein